VKKTKNNKGARAERIRRKGTLFESPQGIAAQNSEKRPVRHGNKKKANKRLVGQVSETQKAISHICSEIGSVRRGKGYRKIP